MLAMLTLEDMDEMSAMDYLDELEFTARQLTGAPFQGDQKERQENTELTSRVKKRLAKCLKRRQKTNYRRLCRSNLSKIWQLKKLVDAHPSIVLHAPDDFILHWYVHGEFPCDMSSRDMEQTHRELQGRLNRLIYGEEWDFEE